VLQHAQASLLLHLAISTKRTCLQGASVLLGQVVPIDFPLIKQLIAAAV
jgi:hypothetical protein